MKYLMLIVDDFEDVEAIATLDVLTRGGEEVHMVSLMKRKEVKPKVSAGYLCHKTLEEIDYKDYDGLIIPGGPGSFNIMPKIHILNEIITYFYNNKKLIAAICAAPFLLGRLGYLKNMKFTVHPGFENQVIDGIYLREKGVVLSSNIITAKSMYYTISFALKIYEYFHGIEAANKLEKSLQGEK